MALHSHICGYCGSKWSHDKADLGDSAAWLAGHTCEKCGTTSFHKSADSLPEFLRGLLSCHLGEHNNSDGTVYCDNCGERLRA